MNKTNTQIAEEIKQAKLKAKRKKRVTRSFDKSAEKKEYLDAVENFVIVLPNMQ